MMSGLLSAAQDERPLQKMHVQGHRRNKRLTSFFSKVVSAIPPRSAGFSDTVWDIDPLSLT